MSNKSDLQENNVKLQTIKSTIEDLPLADDVKNGQYAWGKYTTEGTPVIITADNLNEQSDMRILIRVYSSNIDVGDLTAADFVGTTMTREGESYPTITFTSVTECVHTYSASTDPETVTWDYEDGIITVNSYSTNTWYLNHFNLDISGFNKTIGTNVFVGYVVSDSADEYPNRGSQGGYYYEKVSPPTKGITYGTVTVDGITSVTVQHGLGVVPRALVFAEYERASNANNDRTRLIWIERGGAVNGDQYEGYIVNPVYKYFGEGGTYVSWNDETFTVNTRSSSYPFRGSFMWQAVPAQS